MMKDYVLKGGPEAGRVVQMDSDQHKTWNEVRIGPPERLTTYRLVDDEMVFVSAGEIHDD